MGSGIEVKKQQWGYIMGMYLAPIITFVLLVYKAHEYYSYIMLYPP